MQETQGLTNSSSATGRAKTSAEEEKDPDRPACSLERVVRLPAYRGAFWTAGTTDDPPAGE